MHLQSRHFLAAATLCAGLTGLAFVAASGSAATATAPSSETRSLTLKRFNIDPVHSAAVFAIEWQSMTPFYGHFTSFSGTVEYDGQDASTFSCDITIPVESIDTHSDGRDRHLKSPDFFNAPEYPNLNFRSTGLTDNGDGRWTLRGDLTMRGQTKPVEAKLTKLAVREGQRGTRCGFAAEFTVKRTDWGVSYGAGQGLGEDVTLMVAIQSAAE